MKIILTEQQYYNLVESYDEEYEQVKNALYSIWKQELKKNGVIDFDPSIAKYLFSYPGKEHLIYEMYRDFLGGWDKMVEKSFQLMDRTFDTNDYPYRGGYDFRFKIVGNYDSEEDNVLNVNGIINSDGKVTIMYDEEETMTLLHVEENEEIWWEVENEINDLIYDILYDEVTKKTGIIVSIFSSWIE